MSVIHLWKKLSLLFPPSCRFYPTCSSYSEMAIKKYGVMKGGIISLWRVLRCNPFSRGGVNYPEEDMEKLERIKYFFKEKENE